MDREALIEGIRRQPHDRPRYLILADWMEENGEAERGEYVRLDLLDAGRLWGASALSPEGQARRDELGRRHRAEWFGWLRERGVPSHRTHGGMVGTITITSADFLKHGEELLRREPIHHVILTGDGWLADVVMSPLVRRLSKLDLSRARGGAVGEALASSPHLANLKEVCLPAGLDDAALAAFLSSPHLGRLESLDTEDPFGPDSLAALERGTLWGRLQKIELQPGIGDAGVARLAALPSPTIVEVWLKGCGLTDEAASALADADWPALSSLWLGNNRMGWDGLAAIVTAPRRASLHSLDFEMNRLHGRGPARRWPDTGHLRGLVLAYNHFDADDAALMARLPWLGGVERLSLHANEIGDTGAMALGASPCLRALTSLDLAQNDGLGAAGTRALVSAGWARKLRDLALWNDPLGDDGAVAIAEADALTNLVELSISGAGIGGRGAMALASSPYLGRVERLFLRDNPIGAEGARALAAWPGEALKRLDVDDDDLPEDVKAALAARTGVRHA